MEQTCVQCFLSKPLSEFYARSPGIPRRNCKECFRALAAINRSKNRKARATKQRAYYQENIEQCRNYPRKARAADPKKARRKDREKYAANPGKIKANTAKYRAAKLERTPPWADLEAIEAFYIACPKGYHVDHIIPLQGEKVSGLHVLENLQYLTAEGNHKKGNKFIPYSI